MIARGAERTGGSPIPAADTVLESDNLLLLAGNRIRVEDAHPGLSGWPGGRPQSRRRVVVWDGAVDQSLMTAGTGPAASHSGYVRPSATAAAEVKTPVWLPVVLTARGVSPGLASPSLTDVAAGPGTEAVDGRPCGEYVHRHGGKPLARLWLDPQAGFVPRRVTWELSGGRSRRLDVRYRPDPTVGRLPTEWTLAETDPGGRVTRTTTATITSIRLNEPIPDEQFQLTFPPGAAVFDERVGKEFHVGPDGAWSEARHGGAEPPGSAPVPSPVDPPTWRLVAAGVVGAAGLIGLVVAWWRSRRPTRTEE